MVQATIPQVKLVNTGNIPRVKPVVQDLIPRVNLVVEDHSPGQMQTDRPPTRG